GPRPKTPFPYFPRITLSPSAKAFTKTLTDREAIPARVQINQLATCLRHHGSKLSFHKSRATPGRRAAVAATPVVSHVKAAGGRPLTSGSALSRRNREFRQGGVTRCP